MFSSWNFSPSQILTIFPLFYQPSSRIFHIVSLESVCKSRYTIDFLINLNSPNSVAKTTSNVFDLRNLSNSRNSVLHVRSNLTFVAEWGKRIPLMTSIKDTHKRFCYFSNRHVWKSSGNRKSEKCKHRSEKCWEEKLAREKLMHGRRKTARGLKVPGGN